MGILLSFLPFVVFAVLAGRVAPEISLAAGALTSAIVILYHQWPVRTSIKVLEAGTFVLFAGLAALTAVVKIDWTIPEVRVAVDGGLFAIGLLSLIFRRPFTLQYARESVPREFWNTPQFLRTNDIITAAWVVAFAIIVVADVIMAFVSSVPMAADVLVIVLALAGAVRFTGYYTRLARSRAAAALAGASRTIASAE